MNTDFVRPAVATVPTVYGIETIILRRRAGRLAKIRCNSTYRLRYWNLYKVICIIVISPGCNSTYRLRYWNLHVQVVSLPCPLVRCNSTYRLRYWNGWVIASNPSSKELSEVATVFTVYGIETLKLLRKLPILWIVATVLTIFGICCMMRITKIEFL